LDAIHSDLSPNLSPTRREALIFTPLPLWGRGWGLGFFDVLHATENCYIKPYKILKDRIFQKVDRIKIVSNKS
jgi:hypothetical protein